MCKGLVWVGVMCIFSSNFIIEDYFDVIIVIVVVYEFGYK